MDGFTIEIQKQLASPFEDSQVGWKPQVTTKGKSKEPIMRGDVQVAGCTAHIDARAVMNRLDEVVGVGNWSDRYTVLPNGENVECTLIVFGVSKSDVGEPNDGGFADKMKAAYSDALKRAAVKFGIGRYLYDMEMEWLPFDGYKITQAPKSQPASQRPVEKKPPVVKAGVMPGPDPRNKPPKPANSNGLEGKSAFRIGDTVTSKKDGSQWSVTAVFDEGEVEVANGDGDSYIVSNDKLELAVMA